MENGNIVFDDGGFTDHQAGGMVKHDTTADFGGGVDIDGKNTAQLVLQEERQRVTFLAPQPVSDAVTCKA